MPVRLSRIARSLATAICLVALNPAPSFAAITLEQAVDLYQQVLEGERSFDSLTQEQKMAVSRVHRIVTSSSDADDERIGDYDFSLRDIERKCEVEFDGYYNYEIDCRGSALRVIERKCEGEEPWGGEGAIDCRGSDLRVVERKCTFEMVDEVTGEIDC